MECRLGAREEERESSHRHVLPLRRKDGRRDGDIAYMRSTKAGYPVRWIRISRGCKNYRSERIISSVALCGIGRNSSECLSSIPSRNRARGDTKMHSSSSSSSAVPPCVTTRSSSSSNSPKVHFKVRKLENPPAGEFPTEGIYLSSYRSAQLRDENEMGGEGRGISGSSINMK